MKLIKMASGKQQIKMSRKEWEAIGKKAGWGGNAFSPEDTEGTCKHCKKTKAKSKMKDRVTCTDCYDGMADDASDLKKDK